MLFCKYLFHQNQEIFIIFYNKRLKRNTYVIKYSTSQQFYK
jgi:hypothetical protein